MTFSFAGREYHGVIGSDLDRDGMYLEVQDSLDSSVLIEVFYSDQRHTMTVTLYGSDMPIEVVEWSLTTARTRLPPAKDA
jgi:hypothetical protein